MAVPVGIIVPLGMATLLNSKKLVGKRFWRVLFYMPYMVPAISSIFIWQSFLNGDSGWLNRVLRDWFGLPAHPTGCKTRAGFWSVSCWWVCGASATPC